jgi:hypothetical protein
MADFLKHYIKNINTNNQLASKGATNSATDRAGVTKNDDHENSQETRNDHE